MLFDAESGLLVVLPEPTDLLPMDAEFIDSLGADERAEWDDEAHARNQPCSRGCDICLY